MERIYRHTYLHCSKLCGKQVRERFGDKPANLGDIDQPFVFALVKSMGTTPQRVFYRKADIGELFTF